MHRAKDPKWSREPNTPAIVVSRGEPTRPDWQMREVVTDQARRYLDGYTDRKVSDDLLAAAVRLIAQDHIDPVGAQGVALMRDHFLKYVDVATAADPEYVEGGWAEMHPFDPAGGEDVCLYRMAEGYVCGSPQDAPIHPSATLLAELSDVAAREDWARTTVAAAGHSWSTHFAKFDGTVLPREDDDEDEDECSDCGERLSDTGFHCANCGDHIDGEGVCQECGEEAQG
jgi:hypothetical protein